jgi:hypothetical protein
MQKMVLADELCQYLEQAWEDLRRPRRDYGSDAARIQQFEAEWENSRQRLRRAPNRFVDGQIAKAIRRQECPGPGSVARRSRRTGASACRGGT